MLVNNENVRAEEENGRRPTRNETIVYKIVNYMSSLIGGINDNVGRNNPCIGILSPMSPIMIAGHNKTVGNTMVLPSPEPIIQMIPNQNLKNSMFFSVYNGDKKYVNQFGPKVTPYTNLNNGLLAMSEKGDQIVTGNISLMSSPTSICLNSSKNKLVNPSSYFSRLRNPINECGGFVRSPINSCFTSQISKANEQSITEILVSPELAQTLQQIISIISHQIEIEDSESSINPNYIKGCIKINKYQRINKKSTIGGLNYALMSYSASIIQKHYRNFDNSRMVRYINPITRNKYSKNQIMNAIHTIQRYWRIYIYRNQLMREILVKSVMTARNAASCKIASIWKGYKTRKFIDSIIKDVYIKWIWSNDDSVNNNRSSEVSNIQSYEYTKYDVKLRGSFTCKPWQEHLKLNWNNQENCFLVNICLTKGAHYLQFIINDEIKACGSMEIVVLPIIGVSNKINIVGEAYKSSRKFISFPYQPAHLIFPF
ncbi:IQ calmodulin-binding motif family [Cryptosporidium sp. chipmunk genotype I]|uniref:IQ calmodulin-binding motif family n=1 Tax=Cryptosporidium sp. chipmunk genotype I TaxID=1280935 RepID=UPI00351A4CE8|nr:IQ calmodulin-binding motif family [Cryptosporidium sp. chipmunk genotype I]